MSIHDYLYEVIPLFSSALSGFILDKNLSIKKELDYNEVFNWGDDNNLGII